MQTSQIKPQENRQPSVVIIGAGMTGMGLVIKLREAGITNVTVLEKAHNIGGTWRENRYPGVACDVPSHAYTYSFEPNPNWSKFFADGAEIQQYFEKVYYKYGIDACTHLNEAVTSAIYDEETEQWTVKTSQNKTYVCDILFSAAGILHKPQFPDIDGIERFKGTAMHSAQWDESVDFSGKKIGVIGTGSTAAQIIPELIKLPNTDVTVFQRTPQWIVHAENKDYSAAQKQAFKAKPQKMKRVRDISLGLFEQGTTALTGTSPIDKLMHKVFAWNAKRNLDKRIKDPVLKEKLTPKYKFGCKRVVMNGTFYDAIQKPNAHLETHGIVSIDESGINTNDGKHHDFDIIVYATGFDPVAYMRPMELIGRNGVSIEAQWQEKIQAYRSMLLPNFPNFFLMLGPNSPIGNYSVIYMSEVQSDYAIDIIKRWQAKQIDTIEVKPAALQAWRALLKSKMSTTVWASGGCNSWYLDADGDPLTWPDKWKNWVSMMADVDMTAFYSPQEKPQKLDKKQAA